MLALMAVGEGFLPFWIAIFLFALTIALSVRFCVVGCRNPPKAAAVCGLFISAFNMLVVFLLVLASLTAAGLGHFR